MLLTGNMKPERRMVGMKKRNEARNASRWVDEIVEMKRPKARPQRM